jgi:hypothetical protein
VLAAAAGPLLASPASRCALEVPPPDPGRCASKAFRSPSPATSLGIFGEPLEGGARSSAGEESYVCPHDPELPHDANCGERASADGLVDRRPGNPEEAGRFTHRKQRRTQNGPMLAAFGCILLHFSGSGETGKFPQFCALAR